LFKTRSNMESDKTNLSQVILISKNQSLNLVFLILLLQSNYELMPVTDIPSYSGMCQTALLKIAREKDVKVSVVSPRDGIHQYFYNFSIFFLSFF
jgi:hypothetical protein